MANGEAAKQVNRNVATGKVAGQPTTYAHHTTAHTASAERDKGDSLADWWDEVRHRLLFWGLVLTSAVVCLRKVC
jgi:hypothetical protein